jgi:hypothetical protein
MGSPAGPCCTSVSGLSFQSAGKHELRIMQYKVSELAVRWQA